MTVEQATRDVAETLARYTYLWGNESDVQAAMWDILTARWQPNAAGHSRVHAEYRLSPQDRPDFFLNAGGSWIAIEVKVKGSPTSILRQLGRYAAHEEVHGLVLASPKRTILANTPDSIHGKPVRCALLGGML